MTDIPPKIKGIKRILRAACFSWEGFKAAYQSEEAFRQDVWIAAILLPLSYFIKVSTAEHILLIASVVFLLVAELINTAIEVVIERISPEWHSLSKKAKDIGSSIVFLALVLLVVTWGLIILG